MLKTIKIAVAAVTLGVSTLFAAAPAHADQFDYVTALDDAGVYYSDILDVMDTGKLVCRSLRGGGSGLDAVSGFNAAEARIVLSAARANMCPDA